MTTTKSTSLACSLMAICVVVVSVSAQPTLAPAPSALGPSAMPMGPSAFGPSAMPMGPSASGPSSNDCLTQLLNMSDCLSYVTAGSNVTVPDKPCCPELAGLVESNPICLCDLLGQSSSFGLKIDLNRALKLPSICNVTTPPVSYCSVVGVGVPTPSEGPTMSPGGLSPTGLSSSPSAGNNSNGASSNEGYVLALLVGLVFAFII